MTSDLNFNSQFADGLRGFILEKRELGCKYKAEAAALRLFDEYVWVRHEVALINCSAKTEPAIPLAVA